MYTDIFLYSYTNVLYLIFIKTADCDFSLFFNMIFKKSVIHKSYLFETLKKATKQQQKLLKTQIKQIKKTQIQNCDNFSFGNFFNKTVSYLCTALIVIICMISIWSSKIFYLILLSPLLLSMAECSQYQMFCFFKTGIIFNIIIFFPENIVFRIVI